MKTTIYAIDAPNMTHRANAMGDLQDVLPNMLSRFLSVAKPSLAVALWDDTADSFRREIWEGYKADRERKEGKGDMLREASEIFKEHGIAQEHALFGAEADDLIATIAQKAPRHYQVVMMSSDKDLFQCVSVRAFLAVRRKGKSELWRNRDIQDKYGISGRQWPAVSALVGAKNGVPGLPGIGLKGACKLVDEFGTLDRLLSRSHAVSRKSYRESLRSHAEEARLYLDLLTLRIDIPMESSIANWEWSGEKGEAT